MSKKLKISIGPNRDEMQVAYVNDSSRPTLINSDLFVGRVLIKIRDFDGITPDGSPPIRDHVYFDGRSRKFDIQIEGRFRSRHGVPPYSGEEIHFGSDFDHLVDFPKSAFNAGMRVARWIDPNTFYELSPPSGRPFIMSPYLACMNTLCAWPSPSRLADALVCLRQSDRDDENLLSGEPHESAQDMVPMEQVDSSDMGPTTGKKKIGRHRRRYWRFIGLRGDGGQIDAFLEKNRGLLALSPSPCNDHSPPSHPDGNPLQGPDEAEEGGDALSCRAPSSHATYSTAIEGIFDFNRAPSSAASSYQFSSRAFPRHQVSFGAGLRDTYQDAETEAKEREGETRAQMVMESMGVDEQAISAQPPSAPTLQVEASSSGRSVKSDETSKKVDSRKVKHRLKMFKTALQKFTTSPRSSSPDSYPRNSVLSASAQKQYSTSHQPKDESLGNMAVVPRAASRRLPKHRTVSRNLKSLSSTEETLTSVLRRATLMPRPQSHHPFSHLSTSLDPLAPHQSRSTSFDHNRLATLSTSILSFSPARPTPSSNVPVITEQESLDQPQSLGLRTPSNLSGAGKSDQAESLRAPSSSSVHLSDTTSETSNSPMAWEGRQQALLPALPYGEPHHPGLIDGTRPENAKIERQHQKQSSPLTDGVNPLPATSHTVTLSSLVSAPLPTLRNAASSSEGQATGVEMHEETGKRAGALINYARPPVNNKQGSVESSAPTTQAHDLDATPARVMTVQSKKPVGKADIDQAPELKDVEFGDLMFADMLNLSGDSTDDETLESQLGPWRFKNPKTDILEDNTFVFLDRSVDVQKRRKHFSEANGKHRKSFTYDPDVVYATSFFSPFMDFNTFDLAIGPVKMNLCKILGDMPVRYTLRSTRIDQRGLSEGVRDEAAEEEIFVTISFELVDA